MTAELRRPALVVIDVQRAIDDPNWGPRNNADAEDRIAELLDAWRSRALPLVHIRHDSTEPNSAYRPGQAGNDFKPVAAPRPGETIVVKQTNSAFIGTDLATRLDRSGCDAVVYAGVITNNSLEATVRMSGNLGYRTFVVSDGCWTVDLIDLRGHRWNAEDVHALALANMQGEYGTVVTTADILDLLATPQAPTEASADGQSRR